MSVKIIKEGKEMGQGVAYLDDGTMIVVDNGRRNIGKTIEVTVTSVLQTPAGRMIFARLKEEMGRENRGKRATTPWTADSDRLLKNAHLRRSPCLLVDRQVFRRCVVH